MTIRVGMLNELPKRTKRITPRIMKTVEWTIALNKLAEGLKPKEFIAIVLTPDEMAKYGIRNIRSAARPIKAHMKKYGLPYTVRALHTAEGATIRIMNDVIVNQVT